MLLIRADCLVYKLSYFLLFLVVLVTVLLSG